MPQQWTDTPRTWMEIGPKGRVSEAAIGSNGRFDNCRIPLVPDRPRAVFTNRFGLRQPRYAYSKSVRSGYSRRNKARVVTGPTIMRELIKMLTASRRAMPLRFVATAMLLTLAACSHLSDARKPTPEKNAPRAQLSIGYSLLYQEAEGIPKLKARGAPHVLRLTQRATSSYQRHGGA
jgi:hypothetical protein